MNPFKPNLNDFHETLEGETERMKLLLWYKARVPMREIRLPVVCIADIRFASEFQKILTDQFKEAEKYAENLLDVRWERIGSTGTSGQFVLTIQDGLIKKHEDQGLPIPRIVIGEGK